MIHCSETHRDLIPGTVGHLYNTYTYQGAPIWLPFSGHICKTYFAKLDCLLSVFGHTLRLVTPTLYILVHLWIRYLVKWFPHACKGIHLTYLFWQHDTFTDVTDDFTYKNYCACSRLCCVLAKLAYSFVSYQMLTPVYNDGNMMAGVALLSLLF